MKEYHKIETPHKRDMLGTKKLIETEFRNPTVEYLQNCTWIGKEKVDGTNIRIFWDGHKVTIGGRTDKAQLPGDLIKHLQDKFCTNEAEELFEQMFGEKEVYLYGEGYGAGIQHGGYYREDKAFIIFDVKIGDYYLQINDVKSIADAFNVPVVPVVVQGTIEHLVDFIKTKPLSSIAENPITMEGIVAVPLVEMKDRSGERVIVKIKCCDY